MEGVRAKMDDNAEEVVYRIDRNDVLVDVNDRWDEFAVRNNSPHLSRFNVLRHTLWTYIHDAETRHVHKVLVHRVRGRRTLLNLPFRCDSPAYRRYMEMDIVPGERGSVEYHCRLIRSEARRTVVPEAAGRPTGPGYIRMCSWCNKVQRADRWVELEEAVASQRLFEHDVMPAITHGMCTACLQALGIDEE